MSESDFQRWMNAAKQKALHRQDCGGLYDTPCIRVSNDRYAQNCSFEDRLSSDDKQMLHDMGIAI